MTSEYLIKRLNQHILNLQYKSNGNQIQLCASDELGFDINIHLDSIESMVYYGDSGFHEHIRLNHENQDEFILSLILSLSGNFRIIEHYENNKLKHCFLEEKLENEEWGTISTMRIPHWKFWKKETKVDTIIRVNNYEITFSDYHYNRSF